MVNQANEMIESHCKRKPNDLVNTIEFIRMRICHLKFNITSQ